MEIAMPFGSSEARRRETARKHAERSMTCACGRTIWGNAYHIHKRACPAWCKKHYWRANELLGFERAEEVRRRG